MSHYSEQEIAFHNECIVDNPIGKFNNVTEIVDDDGNTIGLYAGIVLDERIRLDQEIAYEDSNAAQFVINGDTLITGTETIAPSGEVKSDGKSSSYYNLPFNERLTAKIKQQIEDGVPLNIETGDVIEMMFGNDFDFGNVEKALRRIYQAKLGKGKAGVDIQYDINKCHWSIDEIAAKV
jgi:hypothetical protein